MTTDARPGLYRLLAWASPSFPIGAFSYSHGLEAAVTAGAVHDRATLQTWVAALVSRGSGRIDADLLREAHHAAADTNMAALDEANRRGLAYRATAELALESAQQGAAFLATCRAAWPDDFFEAWAGRRTSPSPPFRGEREGPGAERREGEVAAGKRSGVPHLTPTLSAATGGEGEKEICHAVAFGAAAARAGIALEDALLGYLLAFTQNLVSAGLRLGVVGQTDGQRILAALEPLVADAATRALTRHPEDFGAAAFAADLASMAHETQYSRLFRS